MNSTPYPGIPRATNHHKSSLPPFVEAALFLFCGMLIGAGLTVFVMNNSIVDLLTRPEKLPERLLTRMDKALDLTEAQHSEAARIIQAHFETLEEIRQRVQPQVRASLDAMRDELATILDDRQRALWEQRFEEIREKWQPGPFIPGELPASRPSD